MDKLLERWHGYQPREQIMLLALGVAAVIFFLILFVIMPLQEWRANEQTRVTSSASELAEVQQLVAQIKAKEAAPSANGNAQTLPVLIDTTLRKNALIMRGFQPGSNGDARLRLENAAYPELAQWLYELEYQHGIFIQELSLTPAKLSGRLMVNLRVSQ